MSADAYACVMMDPPWNESGGGRIKRGADRHYPLLKEHEIIAAVLQAPCWRPAPDAHLWLWVTNNRLASGEGQRVASALGFRPVTVCTWAKDRIGLGQYLRGRTEHMLFCLRGRLPAVWKGETLIEAPRGRHSEKPLQAVSMIELVSPAPRLEMFARDHREGWHVWGNEVFEVEMAANRLAQEELFTFNPPT